MARLLVVDDEPSICWAWKRLATAQGHDVTCAASAEDGLEAANAVPYDAAVLDVRLPGMDGLAALPAMSERLQGAPIIVITAYGDLSTAVEAVRSGAFDYLVKPFDLATAEHVLARAMRRGRIVLRREGAKARDADTLLGASPAMQRVFKQIALCASADACVHIHGLSGAGKELIARAIHRYSRRSAGPLVPVHVAGLSPALAESELFGHVRGAFTGAVESRKGLLEQAQGGTVFLDEVADIPLSLQVKLLRAVELGEIVPVGSSEPRRVDFRVISATHAELPQRVAAGTFRQDLYYRLNTFEIRVPPLCERLEDIEPLVAHFLDVTCDANQLPTPTVAEETFAELRRRPWHGNVRELRNVVDYAAILARGGVILPEHLPPAEMIPPHETDPAATVTAALRDWAMRQWSADESPENLYQRLLELVEPPVLSAALERCGGQFANAARVLGLHRVTLRRKMDARRSSNRTPPPNHPR